MRLWELNEILCAQIWRVTWQTDRQVEVVTFLGKPFAEALADYLDEEELPLSKVWATEPHLLARKIAYMPDLAAVYDPDPARRFAYGGKGRVLVRPADFGR